MSALQQIVQAVADGFTSKRNDSTNLEARAPSHTDREPCCRKYEDLPQYHPNDRTALSAMRIPISAVRRATV